MGSRAAAVGVLIVEKPLRGDVLVKLSVACPGTGNDRRELGDQRHVRAL